MNCHASSIKVKPNIIVFETKLNITLSIRHCRQVNELYLRVHIDVCKSGSQGQFQGVLVVRRFSSRLHKEGKNVVYIHKCTRF